MLFLYIAPDISERLRMCIEMYPTPQLTAHTAHMRNPFHKSMFKFSLGRNCHDNTSQRIDRHQETSNHYLQVCIFQQVFGQLSEERIHNAHLAVQTDDDIRCTIFLCRVQDTRRNIQVETRYSFQTYIGSSGNLCRTFQITLAAHFLSDRIITVIHHTQSDQIIRLFLVTHHHCQTHQALQRFRIRYRNKEQLLFLSLFIIHGGIIHSYTLGCMLGNERTDYTSHQNQ